MGSDSSSDLSHCSQASIAATHMPLASFLNRDMRYITFSLCTHASLTRMFTSATEKLSVRIARESKSPTHLLSKLDPETLRKACLVLAARAAARNDFPVPGGP